MGAKVKFTIKKFDELNIKELYEILQLRNEIFVVEQECVYQDLDDKDKKSYHLFVKNNNEIVAYCRIITKGVLYDAIAIGRVAIKKGNRNKKMATKIMKEAINFIENVLNENEIKLSAQLYLKKFYINLGFEIISKIYLEDGIEHIKMHYLKKI